MKRISCVAILSLLANLTSPAVLSAADPQNATDAAAVSSQPAKPQPPAPATAPVIVSADSGDALVAFEWTAVPNASGYQIFRSTSGVWETRPFAVVTETKYRHDGLTNGATYTYRVAAFNTSGAGPFSTTVSAIPFAASAIAAAIDRSRRKPKHSEAGRARFPLQARRELRRRLGNSLASALRRSAPASRQPHHPRLRNEAAPAPEAVNWRRGASRRTKLLRRHQPQPPSP